MFFLLCIIISKKKIKILTFMNKISCEIELIQLVGLINISNQFNHLNTTKQKEEKNLTFLIYCNRDSSPGVLYICLSSFYK